MTKDQYTQRTKRRAKLVKLVQDHPEITVVEVCEKLGISRTRVYQLCEDEGIVLRCLAKWLDKPKK